VRDVLFEASNDDFAVTLRQTSSPLFLSEPVLQIPLVMALFLNRNESPPHTYWSLVSSNYCVMGSSDRLASVFS